MTAAEAVAAALDRVVDPCSIATGVPITVRDMGLVERITDTDGDVTVHLRVTSPFCMQIANLRERIAEVTDGLVGVRSVTVAVDDGTAWLPQMMSPNARSRLRRVRPLPERRANVG